MISQILPTSLALTKAPITLVGQNFGLPGSLVFNDTTITYNIQSWEDTQIIFNLTNQVSSQIDFTISVSSGGVQSTQKSMSQIPSQYYVQSVTPSVGYASTMVTIIGTGFGASQGALYFRQSQTVDFPFTAIFSWNSTVIVAEAPVGSGDVFVRIGTVNQVVITSNITLFTYAGKYPSIHHFTKHSLLFGVVIDACFVQYSMLLLFQMVFQGTTSQYMDKHLHHQHHQMLCCWMELLLLSYPWEKKNTNITVVS